MKYPKQKTAKPAGKKILCRSLLLAAVLFPALVFCGGCSGKKKKAPVPKTKGLLLLEIYDCARKKQYGTALQKMERYKILDPESAAITELETTLRFNHMTEVIQFYLQKNNFQGALNAVLNYEKKYGISKRTVEIKEQLLYFVRVDQYLTRVKNARSSRSLEQALGNLEKINKERKLSLKTVNFLRKERSKLKYLRKYERNMVSELLGIESGLLLQSDREYDRRTAETLYALVKAVHPEYVFPEDLEKRFTLKEIIPE